LERDSDEGHVLENSFFDLAIWKVKLSVTVDGVVLEPAFEFAAIGKQKCALSFFLLVDKGTVVLPASGFIAADTLYFAISEVPFILVSVGPSHGAFAFDLPIFDAAVVDSSVLE
jgi:hypothetical protein